jgi:sorting nexin-1/2
MSDNEEQKQVSV